MSYIEINNGVVSLKKGINPENVKYLCLIDEQITEIAPFAFANCRNLRSIILGDSIKTIGNGAFFACTSLKSLIIPDSVVKIGAGIVDFCNHLEKIRISNNLVELGGPLKTNYKVNRAEYNNCVYVGNEINPYLILEIIRNYDCGEIEIHPDCKFIPSYYKNKKIEIIDDTHIRLTDSNVSEKEGN